MIGKKVLKNARAGAKSKAANIRDLTNYIADPDTGEKLLYENGRNFSVGETLPDQQAEMIALAQQAPRSRDPVSHYILSWRDGEQPTTDQAEEAVTILLEELNLDEHQAIYGLHRDTDNIHLHLAVNRIHPVTTRAIRPNNNFDIEAVHRAAARIEHQQGWQPLANGRYAVLEDGTVQRRDLAEPPRQPRQRSRDYEHRTGTRSAERIAIEEAAPILREATSWQDLHLGLERIGARLVQKGPGAVLWIGDRPLKPSAVDRGASLGALQKRLGPYQPPELEGEGRALGRRERDNGDQRPGRGNEPGHDHGGLGRDQSRPKGTGAERGVGDALQAALPVLRAAGSWRELHERLAELGVRYERKGSGAVLRVDDQVVKASSLHRSAALLALEKRLGLYQPPPGHDLPTPADPPRAPPRALGSSPGQWQAYAAARTGHYAQKEADHLDLRKRHDAERAALRDTQRASRDEVLSAVRNGTVRQAFRSVIAAEHAAQKAEVRERHQRERKAFQDAHPRFPDLEDWLRARDPAAADHWRYRASEPGRIDGPRHVPPVPADIRAFAASIRGAFVYYHRKEADAPTSFIDRGRSIHVHETGDRTAVLASLQLAAQKWGRFKIAGDDRYRALCTRLAAQHGFQLDNPELQAELRRLREASRGMRAAPPNAPDRRPPAPTVGSKHHIVVANLKREQLDRLTAAGFRPGAVLEIGPNNYQAIITFAKLGSPHDREIAARLSLHLNRHYGDPNLTGAVHSRRAPGFSDRTPERRQAGGTFPDVKLLQAEPRECERSLALCRELLAEREAAAARLRASLAAPATATLPGQRAVAAYYDHHRDISARFADTPANCSRIDSMIALRLRAAGHDRQAVTEAIERCAPTIRPPEQQDSHRWPDYAQRTVAFAFGPGGDQQLDKTQPGRDQWRRPESEPAPRPQVRSAPAPGGPDAPEL